MPSSHRRVGLVLDEGMRDALAVLREHGGSAVPDAGLVRAAVLDGAAFSALLHEATTAATSRDVALRVLRDMRELIDTMTVPEQVRAAVRREIDSAVDNAGALERREGQLALLDSPNPYGAAALDVTDSIDALDAERA